jgi:hypothetical protein
VTPTCFEGRRPVPLSSSRSHRFNSPFIRSSYAACNVAAPTGRKKAEGYRIGGRNGARVSTSSVVGRYSWLSFAVATDGAGRGTIAGTVKDSSNPVLPGALIEIRGTDVGIASDGHGQFRIRDLAPGEYKLTISYLGFAPFGVPAPST